MTTLFRLVFWSILIWMLFVTVTASLERGIFEAAGKLWQDGWFRATLADAYFGFLTIFIWVAYKERQTAARIAWFILFMTLGNIAISIYILIQLHQLKTGATFDQLLVRRT